MSDEVYTRMDNGSEATVRIRNKLDVTTAPHLFTLIDQLVEDLKAKRVTKIVVNLEELQLIDSSGVAAIVGLYKRARNEGGQVQITGARDQPLAIFKLLRMDRVFVLR